ncbi:MAG: hypothetical protein NG740_02650 [Omnitrophica bacterium]|nr:hypothetical protein [Candidatus Omnitrophota bacterium]
MKSSKIRVFFYPVFSLLVIIALVALARAADIDTSKSPETKPAVNGEQLYKEVLDEVVERNRVQQRNFQLFGCTPNYAVTGERADSEKKADIFNERR